MAEHDASTETADEEIEIVEARNYTQGEIDKLIQKRLARQARAHQKQLRAAVEAAVEKTIERMKNG